MRNWILYHTILCGLILCCICNFRREANSVHIILACLGKMALLAFLLNCKIKVENTVINSLVSYVTYNLLYFLFQPIWLHYLCFVILLSSWSRPCKFATRCKLTLPTFHYMYSAWRISYRIWLDNTYYDTAFLIQMNLVWVSQYGW